MKTSVKLPATFNGDIFISDFRNVHHFTSELERIETLEFNLGEIRGLGFDTRENPLLLADGLPAGTLVETYTPVGVSAGRGVVGSDGRCGLALWGDDLLTEAVEGFREGDGLC